MTNASDTVVGDVYQFNGAAVSGQLIVNDDDTDGFFEDSRGGGSTVPDQETGGPQTIAAGTDPRFGNVGDVLELESILTFSGSDDSTVQVLIINNNSIGGSAFSGEFFLPLQPLVAGVDYTLTEADVDPDPLPYLIIPCFTDGTLIRMADGTERPIEDLVVGDMVLTVDGAAREIRWIGARKLDAIDLALHHKWRPVCIHAGALGNETDLHVSQLHRMLIRDWRAEVMFGQSEMLATARDLINGETIHICEGAKKVTYFHLLFDQHEIIFANGAPSESFHPGEVALDSLEEAMREEIFELFPMLRDNLTDGYGKLARPALRRYEAQLLARTRGGAAAQAAPGVH
ncbi:MAG: Hint domain-containing protein [Pseudomonadota bacterium]